MGEDRFAGATDVELSDEGREQSRRLAQRLSQEKIGAIYASPLGRTLETAKILAAPHGLEVETSDGFREISHGHWEQMTRREVEENFRTKRPNGKRTRTHLPRRVARAAWR